MIHNGPIEKLFSMEQRYPESGLLSEIIIIIIFVFIIIIILGGQAGAVDEESFIQAFEEVKKVKKWKGDKPPRLSRKYWGGGSKIVL